MAQNDIFKEIVFIADEHYEAPAFAWGTALAYLLGLVVAEVMTAFISPLVGMVLYGLILVALLCAGLAVVYLNAGAEGHQTQIHGSTPSQSSP